jgi:hypothetical protein
MNGKGEKERGKRGRCAKRSTKKTKAAMQNGGLLGPLAYFGQPTSRRLAAPCYDGRITPSSARRGPVVAGGRADESIHFARFCDVFPLSGSNGFPCAP